MAVKKTGKIVIDYLSDKDYCEYPSLTLAKIIYERHPLDFTDVEHVRTAIRSYRGTIGEDNRKNFKTRFNAPVKMQIADETEDRKPYILKGCYNIGVVSDLHFPNHRSKTIELAYETFLDRDIDCLLINGDLLDNTPYTSHDHPPVHAEQAKKWLYQAEHFLEYTRSLFPKAQIHWLEGNHDNWYQQYLYKKAPILFGDPHYMLYERMNLAQYDIKWLPQDRYLMAGKLAVAHGHFFLRGLMAPVNTARGVYMRAKASLLVGHSHVSSSHTETDLHGGIVTTWSTGCLCTLTPDYQPMGGKSNHGFAHITLDKAGDFTVDNYKIYKGKLYK